MVHTSDHLQSELERQVLDRTSRRIRDLCVELQPNQVVLRGRARTFHLKQLAQQGVRELLPHVQLMNAIVVDN